MTNPKNSNYLITKKLIRNSRLLSMSVSLGLDPFFSGRRNPPKRSWSASCFHVAYDALLCNVNPLLKSTREWSSRLQATSLSSCKGNLKWKVQASRELAEIMSLWICRTVLTVSGSLCVVTSYYITCKVHQWLGNIRRRILKYGFNNFNW